MSLPVLIDTGPSERGWSFYSTVLRCPQFFYWKYVAPKTVGGKFSDYTEPLARGSIFHAGLAHHYVRMWARANGKDPERVYEPLTAMRLTAENIGEVGIDRLGIAVAMFGAYLQRYPTETFEVVAVELPVKIQIAGYDYTARVDLIVKEPSGRIFIYDHKTAARLESKVFRRYSVNGQMFGLAAIGRHLYGSAFGGVVINHASEDFQFTRRMPDPAPWAEKKFPLTVALGGSMIDEMKNKCGEDANDWPAFPSDQSCFGPYGACPAISLCQWGPTT